MSGLDYKSAGVDYDALDAFKRACQREAVTTLGALAQHELSEPANVRGDSAYLLESGDEFIAHVEEGLGTKNLVADAMQKLTGRCFYDQIGIDVVATIVNDMITCGALPFSVAMHAAVGDSAWFKDTDRAAKLAQGFAEGCRRAGAVWGGGETPALPGIVDPSTIVLAGSAVGRVRPKSRRIIGNIQDGDAIIFLASSGVQTNGLSLCRTLAARVDGGYLAPTDDGRTFGEALLDASNIYVRFLADLFAAGIVPHYAVHVTGHGWRKLMRAAGPMVYRITKLGEVPSVFRFIQKHGGLDDREMYATFNMGAGFAVYVPPDRADETLAVAARHFPAWRTGDCVKQNDRKAVEIVPLGVTFEGDTLQVR